MPRRSVVRVERNWRKPDDLHFDAGGVHFGDPPFADVAQVTHISRRSSAS
jgi:hypothetical protein